jgi:hypothetical protein
MAEEGRAVRAALSSEDPLFDYHPMMVEVCRRNAERLNAIIDTVGWPGREVLGGACWAAMWVLHHAIGSPNVMRRGLGLLRAAERRGEVDPLDVALLEDRILTLEGKPQQYGTQVDWDEDDAPIRRRDHATPRNRGGPTSALNGLGECERCNYAKEAPGWRVRTADENGVHTAEFVTPTGGRYQSTAPPLPGAPLIAVSEVEVRIGVALADLHAA